MLGFALTLVALSLWKSFLGLRGSILRYECQFWASYIYSGDLGDDFGTSGSLFGLMIVNFVHLEVVFRPVKGEIQHCFFNN